MSSASNAASLSSREVIRRRHEALAYRFCGPAVLLLGLTVIAPVLFVLAASLTDYRLGRTTFQWIGLGNYVTMFSSPYVWQALRNSAVYTAIVVPLSVFLALFVAVLIHGRTKSRRFYEIVYFLPVASTLTAMSIVWSYVLNGRIGPLADLMASMGLPRLDFFSDDSLALTGLAIIGIWRLVGYNVVLFLAGLTTIPAEVQDAASLDGMDNFFDRLRYVTWPLLAPTTVLVIVLNCIQAFQVFDTVAVLTNGGPRGATNMLLYEINTQSFGSLKIGYGSALTVLYLILIGGFSILQVALSDRKGES
ncbi:ABC transporter permease [Rhizobium rhizosphaerae]|uniref:ABC transporter permease n=1 Tax=Xaviernesmea rhizosphaerae TaxID=1672749 RepID=A0ABX3PH98_9HYPH|nr:sugar ABC transporter permease [Xaviernesmea rhizosphaerae]OQP87475.1 ABC transporter permease [Xaviernesmea rhizosphaerae]